MKDGKELRLRKGMIEDSNDSSYSTPSSYEKLFSNNLWEVQKCFVGLKWV